MRTRLFLTMLIASLVLVACRTSATPSPIKSALSPPATPQSVLTRPTRATEYAPEGLIAFHSTREGDTYQIYVMDGDGSSVRRITNFAPPNSEPTWSPDGSRIAFTSGKDDINNFTLYTIRADGADPAPLLEDREGDNWYPAWSPQGDQIAFQSNRDGNFEIYVVAVETGRTTRLTNNQSTDSMPAWSPDGNRIAFVSNQDGDGEIYVMKADGSERVRLTESPGEDVQPSWSPDAKEIVFISGRDGNGEIYVMNADGSDQRRLTYTETYGERTPDWAADGTKILFSAPYENDWEIYLMNKDGSNVLRLTEQRGDDRHAAWLDID